VVALCDVDNRRAAETYKQYPNAPRYRDFRQMLDKENGNIDAVIVATPDHMHGTQAMWCMERKKHVYVQKPLVRTVWEARQMQGYSNEGTRQCAEIIWYGDIGNVTQVHAWSDRPLWPQGLTEIPAEEPVPSTLDWDLWLGIAEKRPFTAGGKTEPDRFGGFFYQPFNWPPPFEPQAHGSRVRQEGRREPLHVSKSLGNSLRFRCIRRYAAAPGFLVRRNGDDP
jgi:hypothetical protein